MVTSPLMCVRVIMVLVEVGNRELVLDIAGVLSSSPFNDAWRESKIGVSDHQCCRPVLKKQSFPFAVEYSGSGN